MKALLTLKSAINQSTIFGIIALVSLLPVLWPKALVLAADQTSLLTQANIFEIKISDSALSQNQNNTTDTSNALTYDSVIQTDPLNVYVQAYLQAHDSPFIPFTNTLLSCPDWKRVLAISFVESNMGIHHYYFNSSGIGGQEYLRKYSDYGAWMKDMCNLLQTRYDGWTIDEMNGRYVQPASFNWGMGSKKILKELDELEAKANEQRVLAAQNTLKSGQELATIAQ